MEFVEGLSESPDVMEIPVDGIGRVEIHRGRVRVTLTRIIERKGVDREAPCLTLVWTTQAWLTAWAAAVVIHDTIAAQAASEHASVPGLH